MPGWHVFSKPWVESGRLQVVGIVEEQHPDRALLFMQWQQMSWPLLVDSLNRLGLKAVPFTLLLDEYGVIRAINPSREEFGRLVERRFPPPPSVTDPAAAFARESGLAETRPVTALDWVRLGDVQLLWGTPPSGADPRGFSPSPTRAIESYQRAWTLRPGEGAIAFRLGVAYRRRHDSAARQPGDFAAAVRWWTQALELDPNQYIWRRRLQQYGPRLDKPYPFYDWVPEARAAIRARGQTPHPLQVEPQGAEFARPRRHFTPEATKPVNPDPQGRITRDSRGLIQAEIVAVPPTLPPGGVTRLHVLLRPNPALQSHWNNEAEPLQLWVEPPPGWQVDSHLHTIANPTHATSDEERHVEFELRAPPHADPGRVILSAFALYNVCEDPTGLCLFRRLDLAIPLEIRPRP